MRIALAFVLVLAIAALAIGAGYALLGSASARNDPVGKLSPVATMPPGPVTTTTTTTTVTTTVPATTVGEGQDD